MLNKGITEIMFHGDSYMRQMYAAMLITLNGDYKYGSIANATATPECMYHRQFYEKKCGVWQLNYGGTVCNGKLHLRPFLNHFESLVECSKVNGSVVLYSIGNHKVTRYGRTGINNATEIQQFIENSFCKGLKALKHSYDGKIGRNKTCSPWWISTHHRHVGYFEDETPERIKGMNDGMRDYFESGSCGNVNYIDVFNMTAHLVKDHPSIAPEMTYDSVHWGMEVNLIKAQILINALLSSDL